MRSATSWPKMPISRLELILQTSENDTLLTNTSLNEAAQLAAELNTDARHLAHEIHLRIVFVNTILCNLRAHIGSTYSNLRIEAEIILINPVTLHGWHQGEIVTITVSNLYIIFLHILTIMAI